ncbi:hypothetical protein E4U39_005392 [Claviceps sp. Clav50 group G5]|nr:hypothetical protein E4U39_005392 [Claviceps sp. Clav50 group G5]
MGRSTIMPHVGSAFTCTKTTVAGTVCKKVTCTGCGWSIAGNVSRQKVHLENCAAYYTKQSDKGVFNEATRKFEENDLDKVRSRPGELRQTTIAKTSKSKPEVSLDELAARALYTGARPFNTFEHEDMQIMFEAVKRAPKAWKPPCRNSIAGDLLQKTFESVQKEVVDQVKRSRYLSFTSCSRDCWSK